MKKNMLLIWICISLFSYLLACDLSGFQQAKISNALSTPEEVVKTFCELDAQGKRLSSITWTEMLPYITWPEEAMESAAVLISGYKLSKATKTDRTADIIVEYAVIGKYRQDKLTPAKAVEKMSFNVIKTESGWKINSPATLVPHVLPEVLIAHFESLLKEEKDNERAKTIKDKVEKIKQLIAVN